VFKGIRYAEQPERFKPATPAHAWAPAVADATQYGATCIQPNDFFWASSEDCLFLNIWTPNTTYTATHRTPVMVFIYGGGFLVGSGNANYIDGEEYAKKGVILVSFNYRLGILGFFAHRELTQAEPNNPTNFGLLDQILVLEWVKKHIHSFGGDVTQLTVFGESAGAASIEWLLESEHHRKNPLFTKAIFQSAPFSLYGMPLHEAEEIGDMFANYVKCGPEEIVYYGNSTIECLRNVPIRRFMRIRRTRNPFSVLLKDENFAPKLAAPHLDGVNFRTHPYEKLDVVDNSLANYDIIVGTNQDEYMFFMWLLYLFSKAPDTFLENSLDMVFSAPDFSAKHRDLIAQVKALYPKENYSSETRRISDIIGDIIFHCPSQLYAKSLHNRGANVYAYVFAHAPYSSLQDMGVYHAIELPFTFNKPTKTKIPLGQVFAHTFTPEESALGEKVVNSWIQLGKTTGKLAFGGRDWPEFDGHGDEFLWMNLTGNFVTKFKEAECNLWGKVYPGLLAANVVNVDIMQHEPLLTALLNGWGFIALQHILYHHKYILAALGCLLVFLAYRCCWYCCCSPASHKSHKHTKTD
jgi:para-nitrobenzyl esterase